MSLENAKPHTRAVVVAIALFLFFDFTALALNVLLSVKIEAQAVNINLAGRQRMLSQRMAKVLVMMEEQQRQAKGLDALTTELRSTYELFDTTLQGFAEGHQTLDSVGDSIFLDPVREQHAKRLVNQAENIWQTCRSRVAALLGATPAARPYYLDAAVECVTEHNIELLGLMNSLTVNLETQTQDEAARIRWYQGSAFALALINFAGALFFYSRRIQATEQTNDLLDEIINKISASVMVLDGKTDVVLKANRSAAQLFGYAPSELAGKPVVELITGHDGTTIGHVRDGTCFFADTERQETYLDDRRYTILTVIDVTEQQMRVEHLSGLAYHDLLTHLPNRLLFADRLHVAISQAQRKQEKLGILFLDLDRFKPINDVYGHEVGDQVLVEVARRLVSCVRDSDTVSRRGGDEFTMLINAIGSGEDCSRVAEAVLAQMERPFEIRGLTLSLGTSIGIALYPDDGDELDALISHADEAMYRAKQAGRGCYRLHAAAPGHDTSQAPELDRKVG